MKIIVKENRELIMLDADNTQNENEVSAIQIIVPEKYQDWYKKIVFITDNGIVWDLIENDAYTLKRNVTKYGSVKFYISLTKDEQDFRSKEETMNFNENHEVTKKITTEEKSGMEKVIAILEKEITEVNEKEQELTDLIDEVQTKLDNGEFNGQDGADGQDGTNGEDGRDGVSPVLSETATENGYDISITDVNGTRTISLINGKDGQDGLNGKDGVDGKDGKDGQDGAKGEKGDPGEKGEPGQPGEAGKDGKDGKDGTNGANGQDGYTPQRGTDYWTNQDIAVIEQYCANYIDANINQAIGGAY